MPPTHHIENFKSKNAHPLTLLVLAGWGRLPVTKYFIIQPAKIVFKEEGKAHSTKA